MGRAISHTPPPPALQPLLSLKHWGCMVSGFTVNSNEDEGLRLERKVLNLGGVKFLLPLLRSWMNLTFPGLGFSWMWSRAWDTSQRCSENYVQWSP